MADFPQMNPPASITNPSVDGTKGEVVDPHYPCHLHKYAPKQVDDKGRLIDHYTSGEYIVVNNAAEKAAALKDGWSETPVLTPPTDKAKDKAKDK